MYTQIRDLVGIPYKVHGRDKNGMDCYGVAIEMMRRIGKYLPDFIYDKTDDETNKETAELIRKGLPVKPIKHPELYCLVDIAVTGDRTTHVGVYIGGGLFIHATTSNGVCVQSLAVYKNRIKGYYRVEG